MVRMRTAQAFGALAMAAAVVSCGGVANSSYGVPDPGSAGGSQNAGSGGRGGLNGSGGTVAAGGSSVGTGGASSGGANDCGALNVLAHCGSCDVNCEFTAEHAWGVACTSIPGGAPETRRPACGYDHCALGYVDLDGDRSNGCEVSCPYAFLGHQTDQGGDFCGVDDDCDGAIDEDLCDAPYCGSCDATCMDQPHVRSQCDVLVPGTSECSVRTRACSYFGCEPGWEDKNLDPKDGCEAQTGTPSASGPEICDGWDNDGDGLVDEPGPTPEGIDGSADPSDSIRVIGGPCGNDIGACRPGTVTCVAGEMKCVGGVNLTAEACDGIDNDCDTHIDNADTVKCGAGFCANTFGDAHCVEPCIDGACPTGMDCVTDLRVSGDPDHVETRAGCVPRRDPR